MMAAELPAPVGRCSACGAGVFRSFSVTLKSITLSYVKKDRGAPAARLPVCRYSRYVSGLSFIRFSSYNREKYIPHKPFHFWGLSGYT
jgi:hypothetical protein